MNIKTILIYIIVLLLPLFSEVYACPEPSFGVIIKFQRELELDSIDDAKQFYCGLSATIRDLEEKLSDIANISRGSKEHLINQTILEHFENENSTVQVSSLRGTVKSTKVRTYLGRLAFLSRIYNYETAKLDFVGNTEITEHSKKTIGPNGEEIFIFNVEVWQRFIGTKADGFRYSDATKKFLQFKFVKYRGGWNPLKLKKILVKQTIKLEDYEKKQLKSIEWKG